MSYFPANVLIVNRMNTFLIKMNENKLAVCINSRQFWFPLFIMLAVN